MTVSIRNGHKFHRCTRGTFNAFSMQQYFAMHVFPLSSCWSIGTSKFCFVSLFSALAMHKMKLLSNIYSFCTLYTFICRDVILCAFNAIHFCILQHSRFQRQVNQQMAANDPSNNWSCCHQGKIACF